MSSDHFDVRIESGRFPCDALRVRKLAGAEAISRLFSFDLELVALEVGEAPDPEHMAGADVAIVFERDGSEVRRLHGTIAEVDDLSGAAVELGVYRIRVVPRAHRAALVATQDVFVGASVPDIVRDKLGLLGLGPDVELRLASDYPARELVVQYEETDCAFVSRLTEHLGISFFFEHDGGRDVMVFTDHASGFTSAEERDTIAFRGRGEARGVFSLTAHRRVVPSYFVVRDYDYRKPLLDLTSEHELRAHPGGVVEHGAHHRTPEEGKALARVRAEEQQSVKLVYAGQSDLPGLTAGARIRVVGHPTAEVLELLLVEVDHRANLVVASSGDQGVPSYRNTFNAVLAGGEYRPPRVTPKPRIAGLVTGVIDPGPIGSRAYAPIDEQGRYRVRFLFDTAAPGSRPSSGPVRMLQSFVGENYGTHFPLKINAEVLIGFVNGDPDRPIIVGAASNPLKPSPVTSKNPAVNRIRTESGITIDMVDEA